MQIRNIDYALPISGSRRWLHSCVNNAYSDSSDSFGATFGNIALQIPSPNPLLQPQSNDLPLEHDEDCLNLNIFTPNNTTEHDILPVMVWIHGGGFQIGSGSLPEYEGSRLAQKANVIIVSINYRLGCLGFLRLVDITQGKIASTGNEGLNDQITALKWVQAHIHKYGGDKNNVTVFGESAGAMSIACLLASPHANKLFHKAILQSGAGHTHSSIEKANAVAKEFIETAKQLGHSVDDLPALSATELMKIQGTFLAQPAIYQKFGILPFSPVIDGDILLEPPYQAIAGGCAKHISIMAGSNTDEWNFFAAMLKQNIPDLDTLKATITPLFAKNSVEPFIDWAQMQHASHNGVEPNKPPSPQHIVNAIYTQYWFTEPCHRLLKAQSDAGGKAYGYLLGRRSPIESLGCTHVADIGFVFDTTNTVFHGDEPRVSSLIEQMQGHWGHFAHKGEPSHEWSSYYDDKCGDGKHVVGENAPEIILFGHETTQSKKVDDHTIALWSTLSDHLLSSF